MGRVRRYFYYAPAGPRLRGHTLPAGPVENRRDGENATTAAITRSAMRVAPSPSLFQRDRVMVASAEMDARTTAGEVCESQVT